MNDIGLIVHCGGVNVRLQRVDRKTDYNDLLHLLSEMTGFDLNEYSLKVPVELFVEQEMLLLPQTSNVPMNDVFNDYASHITSESEMPAFTNVNFPSALTNYVPTSNANDDEEFTRGVDDIPCDTFGPNDPPNFEPDDDEGYSDEDHNVDDHVQMIGHVQLQSAPHPSLSRASFFRLTV
ncbi:hypothetical protein ACS0TY_001467 [Phlomoides rotata]